VVIFAAQSTAWGWRGGTCRGAGGSRSAAQKAWRREIIALLARVVQVCFPVWIFLHFLLSVCCYLLFAVSVVGVGVVGVVVAAAVAVVVAAAAAVAVGVFVVVVFVFVVVVVVADTSTP
jgi:hypothetical protein